MSQLSRTPTVPLLAAVIALSIPTPAATAAQPAEVLEAFERAQDAIAASSLDGGQQNSLSAKLASALEAYRRGQPCTAASVVGAFLNEAQALRHGSHMAAAEEMYADGRALRDLLWRRAGGRQPCTGQKALGKESSVTLSASDNERVAGRVTFGGPTMWTVAAGGELFTHVAIAGIGPLGPPGYPGLPVFRRLLAVPRGADVSVRTRAPVVAEEIQLNLHPFQNQPADQVPPSEFGDPPFVKNAEAYAIDAALPVAPCTVTPLGRWRDLSVAQVACAAGRYNPVDDRLTLFREVEFEVRFAGGSSAFVTDQALSPFEPAVDEFPVLNAKEVGSYVEHRAAEPPCAGEELVILAPTEFKDAAEKLAAWKREKGIATNVFLVSAGTSDIGPDATTADEIDTFIKWRYDHCRVRPSYVLLLGDAEWIPTFYVETTYSKMTGSDYSYAAYPQLAPIPIDIFPYFAVGRLPVDPEDAAQVVDKIIAYEKTPPVDPGFYSHASLLALFQCCQYQGMHSGNGTVWKGWDQRQFIESAEFARDLLIREGYAVERIYRSEVDPDYLDTPNADTTPQKYTDGKSLPSDIGPGSGFAWDGSKDDVVAAFNAGRFLVLQRGHGSWLGWKFVSFDRDVVDEELTNGRLQPVVFSMTCSTGLFDNETNPGEIRDWPARDKPYPSTAPFPKGTGPGTAGESYFAERLVRKADGGAIAVVGATRDSPSWANNLVMKGMFDSIWPGALPGVGSAESRRRLGDVLDHGKSYMLTQVGVTMQTGPAGGTWDQLKDALSELSLFHLLGDPTMEIWTHPPPLMVGDIEVVEVLDDMIRVRYPEEGATITAWQVTEEVVPIARSKVHLGEARLPYVLPPRGDAPILFSASKQGAVGRLLVPSDLPE